MRTLLCLLTLSLGVVWGQEREIQGPLSGPYVVLEVIDGDTIKLTINGTKENVRLIGIDTPETRHPTRGVEPFGPQASQFTKELLENQRVWVEFDVGERDHYRRPLAYVYYPDPKGDWTGALVGLDTARPT